MPTSFFLGPQRPNVNLALPFAELDDDRPVAVIAAGWQDVEGDITHVEQAIARPIIELRLYQRAEEVFEREVGLQATYRKRQDKLKELQRLYRIRLRQTMLAARRLLREDGDPEMLRYERRHAIAQQKALDRHHLRRIAAINAEFDSQVAETAWPILEQHRNEIIASLEDCETVLITGGHVAVLLNRLQLFDLGSTLRQKNIVAWSAGAMVLTQKIVLFHDKLPQGNRDAEVFNQGLGIVDDIVFLPDAKHRLKLDDTVRAALLCQRFAPASCVTLDSGSLLRIDDGQTKAAEAVRRLSRDGGLQKVRAQ